MQFVFLSQTFYDTYKNCAEILQKPTRPYACLSVKINGVTFAIPFRHHIAHKYAFFTHGTAGLDYTKSVVIADPAYISSSGVHIEQKDFNALKGQERAVVRGLTQYIKLFRKASMYPNSPHYANILNYSSLKYFKKHLLH